MTRRIFLVIAAEIRWTCYMRRCLTKSSPAARLGIAILILFVSSAFALDPTKAITQYVHNTWTAENGLPENSINSIVQTRDVYLWFGTFDIKVAPGGKEC